MAQGLFEYGSFCYTCKSDIRLPPGCYGVIHLPYLHFFSLFTFSLNVTHTTTMLSCTLTVLVLYRQWEHTEAAPHTWYVQTTVVFLQTFCKLTIFIPFVCYTDMISEWLNYCIYLRSISQGIPQTASTSRYQTILTQLKLISSIYNLSFTQILMYTLWGRPTKGRNTSELQCFKYKKTL